MCWFLTDDIKKASCCSAVLSASSSHRAGTDIPEDPVQRREETDVSPADQEARDGRIKMHDDNLQRNYKMQKYEPEKNTDHTEEEKDWHENPTDQLTRNNQISKISTTLNHRLHKTPFLKIILLTNPFRKFDFAFMAEKHQKIKMWHICVGDWGKGVDWLRN